MKPVMRNLIFPMIMVLLASSAHAAGGKVMSEIKPRHAIGYHFFNEEGTRYGIYDGVRQTYSGPLSLAADNMVWNITKDKITERMAVVTPDANVVPGPSRQPPPEKGRPDPMSDFIKSGEWGPGFNAQNRMLDRSPFAASLLLQDWRKQKPWYKPTK